MTHFKTNDWMEKMSFVVVKTLYNKCSAVVFILAILIHKTLKKWRGFGIIVEMYRLHLLWKKLSLYIQGFVKWGLVMVHVLSITLSIEFF